MSLRLTRFSHLISHPPLEGSHIKETAQLAMKITVEINVPSVESDKK